MNIIASTVRYERSLNNRQIYRDKWWHYAEKRPALYNAIAKQNRVLVCSEVTKHLSFCFLPNDLVYSANLDVFTPASGYLFAILQTSLHDIWARLYSSHLETRLKYSTGNSFETFPFPINIDGLDDVGEHYHSHRQSIMLTRQEGLTKTYNRFHNPDEHAPDIVKLRELHKEMDEAVAHAYGWDDLKLQHGFHETKQGLRYTISEEARREVLDRLLLLNHQRHEEEVLAGLFEKGAKGKGKKGGGAKGARKMAGNSSLVASVVDEGTGVGAPFTNPPIVGEGDVQQGTLFG